MSQEKSEGKSYNYLDKLSEFVEKHVNESRLPNSHFSSTVGIYGGILVREPDGRLFYDITGIVSKVDRFGDPRLRVYDEHILKSNPITLLRRHPGNFVSVSPIKHLISPVAKRFRGTKEQILANIQRLGLEDIYIPHPRGIEIKKPEIYTDGIALQDIYRQDRIDDAPDWLRDIRRFEAVKSAATYMREVHGEYGAIGEPLPSDFIFQGLDEKGQVTDPVLNLPDIIYSPNKSFGRTEQKAMDMFDFMMSIGIEELNRTSDWQYVCQTLKAAVEGYGTGEGNPVNEDKSINKETWDDVISWTGIFARRGRLTIEHPIFTKLHNFARLSGGIGFKLEWAEPLRMAIIEACSPQRCLQLS